MVDFDIDVVVDVMKLLGRLYLTPACVDVWMLVFGTLSCWY